jgi:hypothetical protein
LGILRQESRLDELANKMVVKTTYDNTDVLNVNKAERNDRIDGPQYKGNLVHAARIDMGDVQRLMNMGYNLLSPDPEEVRRALLYIQSNEPDLLTVNGKPFAKVRNRWV